MRRCGRAVDNAWTRHSKKCVRLSTQMATLAYVSKRAVGNTKLSPALYTFTSARFPSTTICAHQGYSDSFPSFAHRLLLPSLNKIIKNTYSI